MKKALIKKGMYRNWTPKLLDSFKPKLLSISDAETSPVNVRIKFLFFIKNYFIDDIIDSKDYKFLSSRDQQQIEAHKFCSDLIVGVRDNGSFELANGTIVRG